jgi:predicted dehydrogenase
VAEDRLHTAASKAPGKVETYADYQKLLANKDINAVVIATPNMFHREMLLAALEAGKHVLCEKPAGVSFSDAAAMKQAADGAKTTVMFGMQYRHNPKMAAIAQVLAEGKIGKPTYLVQNCSRGDWNLSPNVWQYADPKLAGGQARNWRFSHAASGGTLNEYDCHYFDLLHWFAGGLPETVYGEGGIAVYKDGRDTWDHGTVTLTYPNDVTAVHTISLFGPSRADICIMGEEGSIELKEDKIQVIRTKTRGTAAKSEGPRTQEVKVEPAAKVPGGGDPAVLKLYEDFLACVKTGKKADASPARAVAASRTCWLGELSAQKKAPVKWTDVA